MNFALREKVLSKKALQKYEKKYYQKIALQNVGF
jgi:hypothetical protein